MSFFVYDDNHSLLVHPLLVEYDESLMNYFVVGCNNKLWLLTLSENDKQLLLICQPRPSVVDAR